MYTDYALEDLLEEAAGIHLKPIRKKNSQRGIPPWSQALRKYVRRRVETSAIQIAGLLPRSIHAVTSRGFELKVMLFVMAFAIQCL